MGTKVKRSRAKPRRAAKPASAEGEVREVTRRIAAPVERLLWGRAAARCEFWGCNKPLWKSSVTQEPVNIGQQAHIYAFSDDGPRGNKRILPKKRNEIGNLLLVCPECHRKIDKEADGGRYTVAILRAWKAEHERRIEIVTGIDPSKKSHVLLYGANVGDHSSPLNFAEAAHALFPQRHTADERPIVLGTINSAFTDRRPEFWRIEDENLRTLFEKRVRERVSSGEVSHLSVFAIAPQPLLVLLGTLLIDITNADVFQRHREPQTWAWPTRASKLTFEVQEPSSCQGPPALVLALSAPITDDRITAVLGADAAIWRVTVPRPHNDLIKSRAHLSDFRAVIRPLLDRIKDRHGASATLHIFPAAGVSPAIELGRVRMPKAKMPWKVYDQVDARDGFIPALSLSHRE
jgi:hypothetical protein